MARRVLALGGRKSGKSRFALQRARVLGGDLVTFIATAQPGDPELDARIARHRAERPAAWITRDAGVDLAAVIGSTDPSHVILLDSVTLWLSWLHARAEPVGPRSAAALDALRAHPAPIVVVSEEAGSGVVPTDAATRVFLDDLGVFNQQLAALADEAWLLVAGRPIRLPQ
jgi:adenosyl cobinamide kinase/adenosyl cobinamide phosphate guanylyltransferase